MTVTRMLAALGVLAAGLAVAAPARATVLAEVPLEDMAVAADAIVLGEVVHVGVQVRMDGGRAKPVTLTTLRVDRWIKAEGGPTVEIAERGGRWKGGGMHVAGTPRYRVGERVVAFLRRDDEGRLRTYGMALGKLTLQPAVEGPTRVIRDLREVGLASWGPEGMKVEHGGYEDAMTLPELLDRIRGALGAVDDAPSVIGVEDETGVSR